MRKHFTTIRSKVSATAKTIRGMIPFYSLSEDLGGFVEQIIPGAFRETLRDGKRKVSLWQHDAAKPLGATDNGTLELRETSDGLEIRLIPPETTWGYDALESVKRGDVKGFSFRFTIPPNGDRWSKKNGTALRELLEIHLLEVSPVTFPAYTGSTATVRSKPNRYERKEIPVKTWEMQIEEARKMAQGIIGQGVERKKPEFGDLAFDSRFDFIQAVTRAAYARKTASQGLVRDGSLDARLSRSSGLSTLVGSEGAFAVSEEFLSEILLGEYGSKLAPLCLHFQTKEHYATLIKADESSRASGARWGACAVYMMSEGAQNTDSQPKPGALNFRMKKMNGKAVVTEELLNDSTLCWSFLRASFGSEMGCKVDDQILRGAGGGEWLGILNGPGTITVSKEAGQSAATFVLENAINMKASLPASSYQSPSLRWLLNTELEAQLLQMNIAVATEGSYVPAYNPDAQTLLGVKILWMEQCSALGTKGDAVLADFAEYCIVDQGDPKEYQSAHLHFLTAETAFKLSYRADGLPVVSKTVTPANGSGSRSPFVVLETRS